MYRYGINHPNWRGDSIGYMGIHTWLARKYGRANKCENKECPKICKKYEWSNISGKYLREFSDYRMLCISCHRKKDMNERYFNKEHYKSRKRDKLGKFC